MTLFRLHLSTQTLKPTIIIIIIIIIINNNNNNNNQVDWLRNPPAYTQAMEFLDKHWVKTAKGDYVSKKDLSDDMNVTFDDLLSSMKNEQGFDNIRHQAAASASS